MSKTYSELSTRIHAIREDLRDLIRSAPMKLRPHLEKGDAGLREAEARVEVGAIVSGERDEAANG